MEIRLAQVEDVPAIMQIVGRVVPVMRASGNLQWDDMYPNSEVFANDIALSHLWIAEIEDVLAGLIALTGEQYPEYAQAGWDITTPAVVVHRLAVDPVFQGAGVAVALMRQAEAIAVAQGTNRVRVDTNAENLAMQRLLPKLGYMLAGEIGLEFRPGLRFLCYEKVWR